MNFVFLDYYENALTVFISVDIFSNFINTSYSLEFQKFSNVYCFLPIT